MLVSGACGVASPVHRGPCVLTVHLFVSVHFSSVCLLELVLSKFVAPSPFLPLLSIARRLDVYHLYYFYLIVYDDVHHHLFILIPLIFQCDGAGWLQLTGLPWFRTSLGPPLFLQAPTSKAHLVMSLRGEGKTGEKPHMTLSPGIEPEPHAECSYHCTLPAPQR